MSKKSRSIRGYDPQFRLQAVNLVLEEGLSPIQVAKDLGIPHGWLHRFQSGEWDIESLSSNQGGSNSKTKAYRSKEHLTTRINDQQSKIKELEIQVKQLKMEREILKKAMVYCMEVPK